MADVLDDMSVPHWWAIDMPPGYAIPLVELTSAAKIPQVACRVNPSNLSDKRNVGVALSKMSGLKKILFADDDVEIGSQELRSASLMLFGHTVAGLRCGSFPDKAVVDHAEVALLRHHRFTSRVPPANAGHASGNSVAVNVQESEIFFPPEIYNEDLFAFYPLYIEQSAALVDGYYHQADFDPFADPDRARTEEFGEILTHGLYQHLQQRSCIDLTDKRYWDGVIAHRHGLVKYLLAGLDAPQRRENFTVYTELPTFEPAEKEKIRDSLLAALAVNAMITGKECVDYYQAWRMDQERWRSYLSCLPDALPVQDALGRLGLNSYTSNVA